ncbi:amyloid-beta A4 precursor protein-binding family A member 3 isoform X1 [Dermochelys coriacea]|uniref:amyloid-beta A4 precursor protein-binding family A member 3 isoform X1 n=1 Tax=Dermochelys coriacea TaxID=27794 RepID=UPI0018E7B991|nr:amyloid-beta A4 precursor protein-binding family A member 3 isoform X1 [Dermochelys coriacea]XP_038239809.1 amyloid-beta A4 precursor protein-binding family A member 3 isoform X1 [Dermochelys coriacea]
MDNSMDFQTDACPGPGFGSHSLPGELLEPPAMDLEEGGSPTLAMPTACEQSLCCLQQPGSPFSALRSDLNPSATEAELSVGAAIAEPTVPESPLGGLQTPGSAAALDLALRAAVEARDDACRDLGRGMEGCEDAAAPGSDADWKGSPEGAHRGVDCPRVPSNTEQSDLICMDLDEEPEAHLRGKEWAESVEEDDQLEIQGLLAQLQILSPSFRDDLPALEDDPLLASDHDAGPFGGDTVLPHKRAFGRCRGLLGKCPPCLLHVAMGRGLAMQPCHAQPSACSQRSQESHGLLFAEADREDLLSLLHHEGGLLVEASEETPLARSDVLAGSDGEVLQCQESPAARQVEGAASQPGSSQAEGSCQWYRREGAHEGDSACLSPGSRDSSPEPVWVAMSPPPSQGLEQPTPRSTAVKESQVAYPAFKEVAGPCEPEDLLDGVIFGAKYLGSTQLVSERNPPASVRMVQAQEAVDRIKAPEGESQPMTEVDLFVSTQRIKVLTADSQEAMMDHPLQTISYIADIGSIIVLMARRKLPRRADTSREKQLYKMICHVFHSADAQLIAQAIGQAFSVAYQQLLQASGIDPSQLSPGQDSRALESQELHNGDLAHFSKQENCKDVCIRKQKGEILGVAVVESGWGSILPTVVVANLMHGGPAEKCGELSIGDRLMSVNGTSLVGLPLGTCQSIIRQDLKSQTEVMLSIVHCPPVTTAIVRRPDSKYPLGFCVEDGIICSLMRGGIAERGGIRVGHRIIEINGQSVVAMPHEKIIQLLTQAISEVHIKTMPASTYRLLTGQEQPIFL